MESYKNYYWDAERTDALKELRKQGWSASRTADILNKKYGSKFTRNAVLGRLFRLGLTMPPKVRAMQRSVPNRSAPRPKAVVMASEPLPTIHVDDVARKPLRDLADDECKFPVGDPRDAAFGFCALPRVPGRPYCSGHSYRAYQPTPRLRVFAPRETIEVPA